MLRDSGRFFGFDVLWEEGGRRMSPRVALRIIGGPGHIGARERGLQHARSRPGMWVAMWEEIAAWFASHNPGPA